MMISKLSIAVVPMEPLVYVILGKINRRKTTDGATIVGKQGNKIDKAYFCEGYATIDWMKVLSYPNLQVAVRDVAKIIEHH